MDKTTLEKDYEEITDVTFDHQGAHLASTHVLQGGASNGRNTPLILKAEKIDEDLTKALEQVTVTMSMEDYLMKFFGMWYDDAELLTKMMGMETEYEYYKKEDMKDMEDMEDMMMEVDGEMMPMTYHMKYLQEKLDKVEILRSAKGVDFKDLTDEQLTVVKGHLTQFVKGIAEYEEEFTASLEKSKEFSSTAKGGENVVAKESSDLDVTKTSGGGDVVTQKTEGDSIIKEKQTKVSNVTKKKEEVVEKSADVIALEKAQAKIEALEKAAKDSGNDKKALEKAALRIEALEKAEEARLEKAFDAMAQGFTYVADEAKSELSKAMMDIRDTEAAVVVFKALEKAQEALLAATQEVGVEADVEITKDAGKSVLGDLIKAKYDKQV